MKFDLEMSHLFCVFIYITVFTSASVFVYATQKGSEKNQILD